MNSAHFIKIHRTLRMSPAMAADVTNRLWEVSDLVALWESYERRAERAAQMKWEYKIKVINDAERLADSKSLQRLNELGEQGWEATSVWVEVVDATEQICVYALLKRPK